MKESLPMPGQLARHTTEGGDAGQSKGKP